VSIDTAAAATLTYEINAAQASTATFTDVQTLTVTNTSVTNGSINGTVLDDVDTTTLNVTAGSAATLVTGDITGTNALSTVAITTAINGQTATVGTIADADALSSLTVNAVAGNATVGQIGTNATANNAELLAAVNVTASQGATATVGFIIADSTVDSSSDLDMTITANAANTSTVALTGVDNTYGTITLNASGAGTVNNSTNNLVANDVTVNFTAATGTISGVTGNPP
jgi:hypothetical protein